MGTLAKTVVNDREPVMGPPRDETLLGDRNKRFVRRPVASERPWTEDRRMLGMGFRRGKRCRPAHGRRLGRGVWEPPSFSQDGLH